MPVQRFKTHEQAERALWLPPGDPRIPRRLQALRELARWLMGHYEVPRGVFKFRSIEEANAHRDAWERDRLKKIQERNKKAAQQTGDKR